MKQGLSNKWIGDHFQEPDLAQSVSVFRTWSWDSDQKRLISAYAKEGWQKHMQAVCKKGVEHIAPQKDCSCGLYGFYEYDSALDYSQKTDIVIGICNVWGKIEAHEKGLRAQHAQIVALSADQGAWQSKNSKLGEWIADQKASCYQSMMSFLAFLILLPLYILMLNYALLGFSQFVMFVEFSFLALPMLLLGKLFWETSLESLRFNKLAKKQKANNFENYKDSLQRWTQEQNIVFCESKADLLKIDFCSMPKPLYCSLKDPQCE